MRRRALVVEDAGHSEAQGSPTSTALLARTLGYARRYLRWFALAAVLAAVTAIGRNARAYLLKPLLDEAIPQANLELFFWLGAAAAVIVVTMPLAVFGRGYLTQWILGRILLDIRGALAGKLLRLPLTRHRSVNSGDTLSRTLLDATAAQQVNRLVLGEFIQSGLSIAVGIGTMAFVSWKLTLLSLATLPLLAGVLGFFAGRVRTRAARRQAQLSEVTQRLSGILGGIKVIKAFRGQATEEAAFTRAAEGFLRRHMKVTVQGMLSQSLVELVNSATALAVLFVGGYLVMTGTWGLSVGGLSAFTLAAAMTYMPIKKISRGWSSLMEALASTERFFSLLDEAEEPADRPNARPAPALQRALRFDQVSFSYGGAPVLQDITFEVQRGEMIAIVGPTGAGKTTLADLLLRFHDPEQGAIRVDGVDLRDLQRDSFLDQVAVVTQEPFLFDTTIRANILYGRPDTDAASFEDAVRTAHVDEFTKTLPDGLDTGVGESGLRLSGGQRQRITIARAIVRDPSILVFDEATSALDAKTERTVQDALDALQGRRTLFVIAHRLSTVRRADRILVLAGGRIVQQGTHDELLASPGLYHELVSLQSEPEAPR